MKSMFVPVIAMFSNSNWFDMRVSVPYEIMTLPELWMRLGVVGFPIYFEMTAKYRLLHPLILALMAKDLPKNFGDVVARRVAAARGESIPPEKHGLRQDIFSRLAPCPDKTGG